MAEEEDSHLLDSSRKRKRGGETTDVKNSVAKSEKRQKKQRITAKDLAAERALTELLFGGASAVLKEVTEDESNIASHISNYSEEYDELEVMSEEDASSSQARTQQLQPVWRDDDDDSLVVNVAKKKQQRKLRRTHEEEVLRGTEFEERLRDYYENLSGAAQPKWATFDTKDTAIEDSVVMTTAPLLNSKSAQLPAGVIDVTRMKNANVQDPCKAVVQALQFHPNLNLLLTGGYDQTLRLFQVDGKENTKVQSVYLPDLPIRSAFFSGEARTEVICTGRRRFFYCYDMVNCTVDKCTGLQGREERSLEHSISSPCGKYIVFLGVDGAALLVSQRSKQWLHTFKMNGRIRTATFSPDSAYLYTSGTLGEVYQWSITERKCVHKFVDDGCVSASAMGISPNAAYHATGSKSGVVNIYSREGLGSTTQPSPLKSIMNISTRVNKIQFNHDSQLAGICSFKKKNTFKLLHVPSFTVFSNWPTQKTPLGYVSTFDFSANSGYLAIGNDKGKVLLYRLNHYQSI